jgi:DNA-binding NtrC family response regulator
MVMARISVLLVEDSETQAAVYSAYLPAPQFDVMCVTTGEQALAELTARPYSLVLLDLHLPGIQGLEVLRRIVAARLQVPVVVMTDSGSIDTAVEAMHLGARDFLPKPVDPGRLRLAALAALAALAGAERATSAPPPAATSVRPLAAVEREAIEAALTVFGGNVPRAAAALGVSPSTLYRKKQAWENGDGPMRGEE